MAPEDRDRLGSLPHEPPCHWCAHPGHILLCDVDDCLCAYGGMRLGIDTALLGDI